MASWNFNHLTISSGGFNVDQKNEERNKNKFNNNKNAFNHNVNQLNNTKNVSSSSLHSKQRSTTNKENEWPSNSNNKDSKNQQSNNEQDNVSSPSQIEGQQHNNDNNNDNMHQSSQDEKKNDNNQNGEYEPGQVGQASANNTSLVPTLNRNNRNRKSKYFSDFVIEIESNMDYFKKMKIIPNKIRKIVLFYNSNCYWSWMLRSNVAVLSLSHTEVQFLAVDNGVAPQLDEILSVPLRPTMLIVDNGGLQEIDHLYGLDWVTNGKDFDAQQLEIRLFQLRFLRRIYNNPWGGSSSINNNRQSMQSLFNNDYNTTTTNNDDDDDDDDDDDEMDMSDIE